MKITMIAAIAALALSAETVRAQIYVSEPEVKQMTSVSAAFEGKLDGVLDGEVVRFTVNGADSFTYSYMHTGEEHKFNSRLARAGGQKDGNPTLNHKESDNDEVRFEWTGTEEVTFHYWEPGKRAGQRANNPPMAKTVLKQVEESLANPEKVKKVAREQVMTLIPVGRYKLSGDVSGNYEVYPDGKIKIENGKTYQFIKKGDRDACFDRVGGACYTVSVPDTKGIIRMEGGYNLTLTPM